MKFFALIIPLLVIIQNSVYSQESKSEYYFGVELRWATVCEYNIKLEKCTSDDVGAFPMDIEKYPDKIGSLTLDYKGLIKFNILEISFSDPDNYVLKLSDKKSKLYTALLSMDYIPNSRARMYTKLIISDGVEALVFETDIGAIEYMTQIEEGLNSKSKTQDLLKEGGMEKYYKERDEIVDQARKNLKKSKVNNQSKLQDVTYTSEVSSENHSLSDYHNSSSGGSHHHSESVIETLLGRLLSIFIITAILLRLFR